MMPMIILVGVTGGIFTVTESAAVAVLYAAFIGLVVYRELKPPDLGAILIQTALDTALVMFIIALASGFGYLMAISGLPREVAGCDLVNLHGPLRRPAPHQYPSPCGRLLHEAIAAMLILIPVLMPIVQAAGIDLVHFGLIMVFNLMLGLLTPPVGILLYICANFAEIRLEEEVRAVLPFLAMGLLVLVLITYFPALVLWLPNLVLGR